MKKRIKLGVIAAFAVAATAIFINNAPTADASSESVSPRSLYIQNCARCHGSDGRGQTALGKKLEADDLTEASSSAERIVRIVTNGRGKMPSFKRKLSKAQIASIAGYARSLAKSE